MLAQITSQLEGVAFLLLHLTALNTERLPMHSIWLVLEGCFDGIFHCLARYWLHRHNAKDQPILFSLTFPSGAQPLPLLLLGPYPGALAGHAFWRLPLAEAQN